MKDTEREKESEGQRERENIQMSKSKHKQQISHEKKTQNWANPEFIGAVILVNKFITKLQRTI